MNKRFSFEYILSFKDKNYNLPKIDKKYIINKSKKKKYKKKIEHSIDNPWLSSKEKKKKYSNIWEYKKNLDNLEETKLKLTNYLNKLSEKKFDVIIKKIIEIDIQNEIYLEKLTEIIYDKCILEKNFIKLYINVIKILIKEWEAFQTDDTNINFIQTFIGYCHINYINWKKCDLLEESNNKNKIVNNLYLIGELFNNNIISYEIVSDCINELLNCSIEYKELGIELLCKFLSTIGEKYEKINYINLNKCLNKLKKENNISLKNKFLIMDTIDLCKNNWKVIETKMQNVKIKKEVNDNKLHKQIRNILLEYLDVLDMDEIKEYYLEYKSSNKNIIMCTEIFNLFMEENIENKKYLIELMEYLLENNYIDKNTLLKKFENILNNKDNYKIDNPNIDKDILNFNTMIKNIE